MKYARVFLAGLLLVCAASQGRALDAVSFARNWLAEAEHGGFYQALVDGTYERYGLDVKIIQGGPQANNQLLLAAGRVNSYLGANMIQALHAVEQGIPTLVVASLFQKDPLILMSHPGMRLDRFEDLPKATADPWWPRHCLSPFRHHPAGDAHHCDLLSNTAIGLASTDHNLIDLFELYRASRWRELVLLRLSSALPYFLAGLRIGGGLALIGAIVAELAAGPAGQGSGLAFRITEAGYRLNIPRMFAALVLISLTGLVIYRALALISQLALRH